MAAPPAGCLAPAAAPRAPLPLDDPSWRLRAWARHAVWNGVERLGLVAGDEVLMPAYHHGSEVEAVSRRGVQCRFYEGDERLEPTEPELNALLGARTRALYLIH